MPHLLVISPVFVWVLAILGLGLLAAACLVVVFPDSVAKGQDPAGRGMAVGCSMILLALAGALVSIIPAAITFLAGPAYSTPTRIIGWLPFLIAVCAGIGIWISIVVGKSRRLRKRRAEQLAIPAYIIIHKDQAELSRMYDALREHDSATEMQLYIHPEALLWQFQELLPRAKLLCLHAGIQPAAPERGADSSRVLARDLAAEKPPCPIMIYGDREDEILELEKMLAPKWTVYKLLISGDAWIHEQWLPLALSLLPKPPNH